MEIEKSIKEQLLALESREALEDWYVCVLNESNAYLVRLTETADTYAVVFVSADNRTWTLTGGLVELSKASYVDVRRAFEFSCGDPDLELTSEPGQPSESEVAMLLFAEDPAKWTVTTDAGRFLGEEIAPVVERFVDQLAPSAPREVCPLCVERTGGVAEPPAGEHFELMLNRPVKVGGATWPAGEYQDTLLVHRSDLAPHHLVACRGEQRQPICLLPADAIDVLIVDGEEEQD